MSANHAAAMEIMLAAGVPARSATPEFLEGVSQLLTQAAAARTPNAVVTEAVRARYERDRNKRALDKATEMVTKMEQLFEKLVNGNAVLSRLEGLRRTGDEYRAVCRMSGMIRELSIHTSVSRELLEQLNPWDYVLVNENVVVGAWHGDHGLYESSLGEVVDFKGYVNGDYRLARVTRIGHGEEVVTLAESLRGESLTPNAKLVLMRDNPRWAIGTVPATRSDCRFEVPVDQIETRLSDLACIDTIATKLMAEIHKRVIRPDIREQFNLDPLRGMILSSNKPGMGKTAFMRASARCLYELGLERGFDVVLYVVKPNEFKSMWHGEDARIVRDELFGAIRGAAEQAARRQLVQLLVLDEVDSWGRRPEGRDVAVSSAQSDALETLMVELDGMQQDTPGDPPAHLLVVGMTNRPDRIDDAIKRPGRLGDESIEISDLDRDGAEKVCAIYMRAPGMPWYLDGEIRDGLSAEEVAEHFLRSAMATVFPAVVLRYSTDTQRKIDVTAGEMLAAVHYRKAMSVAKAAAADRRLHNIGVPAVRYEDVVEGLLQVAISVASQFEADPQMLIRHLRVKLPVARIDVVPRRELEVHRFLRLQSA